MVSRNAVRLIAVSVAAAVLASCSSATPPVNKQRSKEFFSEAEYGKASPRVVAMGQPVPKGGGRFVIGEPYRVAGKTYIPRDNPDYSATGLASWYGEAFHGRLTANGEVYDVNGLTAAHPTMPLPSYARVTNSANGRSVIVRVNDRGPFARNRVIDLSAKVAEILGFKAAGTAKVKVDYMGPADMDGLDHNKLLASYREGGAGGGVFGRGFFQLAAAPEPRLRPSSGVAYPPAVAGDDPMLLTPAALPSASDPLAPLIMRTSFASGYAAMPRRTDAQAAAEALAVSGFADDDLQAALDRAAARKATELGVAPTAGRVMVQIGTFSNPDNAERVAREFGRFGAVDRRPAEVGERQLIAIRVVVDPSVSPDAVISAAAKAGLPGAFLIH